MTTASEQLNPREAIVMWLEEVVIGLNLCPFARKPHLRDEVSIHISRATNLEDAVFEAMRSAFDLMETAPEDTRTTLIVFPDALEDFATYLDAADAVRETLNDAGAEGILQVATFHPDYRFANTESSAPENFTNRAPYPVLHLLREDDVSRAVDTHPNPESIPPRNIEHMRQIGLEALRRMWSAFSR